MTSILETKHSGHFLLCPPPPQPQSLLFLTAAQHHYFGDNRGGKACFLLLQVGREHEKYHWGQ